jgi:hypothetical protein
MGAKEKRELTGNGCLFAIWRGSNSFSDMCFGVECEGNMHGAMTAFLTVLAFHFFFAPDS